MSPAFLTMYSVGCFSRTKLRKSGKCARPAASDVCVRTLWPFFPTTSTVEIFERRGGICRDMAHLGVTFCRALSIPARYVSGYMPDIGVPGPYPPMDFHAWFEVWLGERWWALDGRYNSPRIGRVPIGRGRDAADVAMITTYGDVTLTQMTVWADESAEAVLPGGR